MVKTGFVSQDEKKQQPKTKPQREIICKGNKIMDFPDMSSLTQARRNPAVPLEVFKSGTTPKENEIRKLSTQVQRINNQSLS